MAGRPGQELSALSAGRSNKLYLYIFDQRIIIVANLPYFLRFGTILVESVSRRDISIDVVCEHYAQRSPQMYADAIVTLSNHMGIWSCRALICQSYLPSEFIILILLSAEHLALSHQVHAHPEYKRALHYRRVFMLLLPVIQSASEVRPK